MTSDRFKDIMKDNWAWFLYLIIMVSLILWPITTMIGSTNKTNAGILLDKQQQLLTTITNSAESLCNYDDLNDQDTCINRLIDDYKRALELVK